MKARCPDCNTSHHIGAAVAGKFAASIIGGALGHAATRNPLVAFGTALVGLAIGEVIDREVLPRCPACGVALQILVAAL